MYNRMESNGSLSGTYCYCCMSKHEDSSFSEGHTVDDLNRHMFSAMLKYWEEGSDILLPVCDMAYKVIKCRYDNLLLMDYKLLGEDGLQEISQPTLKSILNTTAQIAIALSVLLIFLFVGSVPIMFIQNAAIEAHDGLTSAGLSSNVTVNSWSYIDTVYFCVVSMTTIGYGDYYPSTRGGRAYMIFFITFGIMFMGILITFIGAGLFRNFQSLVLWFAVKIKECIVCQAIMISKDDEGHISLASALNKKERKIFFFFTHTATQATIQFFMIWLYMIIGACIFSNLEDWKWDTSFWFVFVTLTTTGYGDIVPKTESSRVFLIFYVLIGLGMVALFLGLIATTLVDIVKKSALRERLNQRIKFIRMSKIVKPFKTSFVSVSEDETIN